MTRAGHPAGGDEDRGGRIEDRGRDRSRAFTSPFLVSQSPLRGAVPMSDDLNPFRPSEPRREPAPAHGATHDLTDEQWAALADRFPPAAAKGRPRTTALRRVVAAIDYRWRTGCGWRTLPPGFPPWPTVYSCYRRWNADGTLQHLRAVLDPPPRTAVAPKRHRVVPMPPKLDPDRDGERGIG